MDDPLQRAAFTSIEHEAGAPRSATSRFQLSGLYCAACAGLIEGALMREPGVIEARVNYATQRATVRWSETHTMPSRLVAAVARAGYSAVPDVATPARELRRREERQAFWRLFVAAFCMMQTMMYAAPLYLAHAATIPADLRLLLEWAGWLLSIPVVLFSAAPFFLEAWRGIRRGRVTMDLPVALGVAVTFCASTMATFNPRGALGGDAYFDSLTMFVSFLLAGRYLALRGRNRVADSLESALSRLPDAVRRLRGDGSVELVVVSALRRGDTVRVLAGEAFPADGPLSEGQTRADEALLTGESSPVRKRPGDPVIAGSINIGEAVTQRIERLGAETRYAAIVDLARDTLGDRPAHVAAADRMAAPFLYGVLVLAAAASAAWSIIDPARAVWVAVSVLIVTCPCALSLAAPSALLAAAGALARRGILVRRLDALETLDRIDALFFDKTGTLTEGRLCLRRTHVVATPDIAGAEDGAAWRAIAASIARHSTHPLAQALARDAIPGVGEPIRWVAVAETPGSGLEGSAPGGQRWRLGSHAWAAADGAEPVHLAGPRVWLSEDGAIRAGFEFEETLRDEASSALASIAAAGIAVRILSGDNAAHVQAVAARLGVAEARGDAEPADKLEAIAELQRAGKLVGMVGDGLNDAPVIARADVSFAMGQGAALTRSRADFIVLSGRLDDIVIARRTAQRAMRVVRQNFVWAVAYNAVCVPLALFGMFPPWAAGLGMATSSLVVVLNAIRIDPRPARVQAAVA